jgi:hypothetical protein
MILFINNNFDFFSYYFFSIILYDWNSFIFPSILSFNI